MYVSSSWRENEDDYDDDDDIIKIRSIARVIDVKKLNDSSEFRDEIL